MSDPRTRVIFNAPLLDESFQTDVEAALRALADAVRDGQIDVISGTVGRSPIRFGLPKRDYQQLCRLTLDLVAYSGYANDPATEIEEKAE